MGRRLRALYLAVFLQNVALWVPIEKLFMTDIGFDNGSVAVMAAAYAAVVPLLEVPSGILADRWSRRGVVLLAQAALIASVVIGGLSPNVATYIVAALFLGVFFALQSGTFESIAYDTVLEETGDATLFERTIGRIRFVESAALVASALAGGVLAEVVPLRATYFLTVPLIVVAGLALLRFREPRLHRPEDAQPLRHQVAATYRAMLERGALRPIVGLLVLTAVLLQAMLEFGPLWLVALAASAGLYGPHWAGSDRRARVGWAARRSAGTEPTAHRGGHRRGDHRLLHRPDGEPHRSASSSPLRSFVVLLVVAVSIPITGRLHDAVPSSIRAGVASGVGTLTWLTFLPFALRVRGREQPIRHPRRRLAAGVRRPALRGLPGWVGPGVRRAPAGVPLEPAFAADRFLPADDPEWPGHWVDPPGPWERLGAPGRRGGRPRPRCGPRSLTCRLHSTR